MVLQDLVLMMVAIGAAAVVFTRQPVAQAIVLSVYGMVLTVMFLVFQAPDVALAEVTAGAVALPLMILLALARIRRDGMHQ